MIKRLFTFGIISLIYSTILFAQEKKVGVFYKIERSRASEGKGISMEDFTANQYRLGLIDDKLTFSFSNANLLERFFLKKNIKVVIRDTNSSQQYVLEGEVLKNLAIDQSLVFAKANFEKEKIKSREKLAKEVSKVLGGNPKDSLNANAIVNALNQEDINESNIKINSVLTRSYSINDYNKLQTRINALVVKQRELEKNNLKDQEYFLSKPKRIIDEVIDKGLKNEWNIVLDTLDDKIFNPSGWVIEYFGPKKKSFLFFVSGTSISYARVKFDTVNAIVMDNLPLIDTNTCTNDLLFASFDAKFGQPFLHGKCNNVTKISCFPTYAPDSYQQSTMTINFPKSVVNDIGGSVKPFIDDIHSRNFSMKHVRIHAYASVEGDSVLNAKLAHDRCLQIVHEFQKYTKDSISYEIETNENWPDFLRDMPEYPTYAQWQYLDRRSLRKVINEEANKTMLEPWLDKHRYAQVEMYYSEHIPQELVLDKMKIAYDSLINNFNNHPIESEMKIAGMRNFLIHQYRHKVYPLDKVSPFFGFRTPRLDIVNIFQQYPLYKKGLSTIQLPFDSILVNALNASVKLYDASTHNATTKEKEIMGGENSPQYVLKSFQTQLLRYCVKLIQDGKMDKNILSKWKFPSSDEFHFFALKSIMQHVDETTYGHSHQPFAEKVFKVKDSVRTVQLFDYELKQCGMRIVCKDAPQYVKVKADIIKHISDDKYDKSISEIIWYFFIENQVTNYNFVDKKLYDDDFNPEKTLQYFEKLNSHLCGSKKDKLLLACYRNLVLYSLKHNNSAHVKLYLDKIFNYYILHKELIPATLVDDLIRFSVYFQAELGEKNECLKVITAFLKHVESKDAPIESALIKKFEYLNARTDY
jgi:hypothetical protein